MVDVDVHSVASIELGPVTLVGVVTVEPCPITDAGVITSSVVVDVVVRPVVAGSVYRESVIGELGPVTLVGVVTVAPCPITLVVGETRLVLTVLTSVV